MNYTHISYVLKQALEQYIKPLISFKKAQCNENGLWHPVNAITVIILSVHNRLSSKIRIQGVSLFGKRVTFLPLTSRATFLKVKNIWLNSLRFHLDSSARNNFFTIFACPSFADGVSKMVFPSFAFSIFVVHAILRRQTFLPSLF